MRFIKTTHFQRSYDKAPARIQETFEKQLRLLLENSRHPSLDAKKYGDTNQARVTRGSWRFYYDIVSDCYVLNEIKKHPKK